MALLWTLVATAALPAGPVPPVDGSSQVLALDYDLTPAVPAPEPRMTPLAPVATTPMANPLALSLFEDRAQRLRIGVGPGGKAQVGMAYRLSLGS